MDKSALKSASQHHLRKFCSDWLLKTSTDGTLGAVLLDERDVHHLRVQEEIFISLPHHCETDTQHAMRQYFKDGMLSVSVCVLRCRIAGLSQKGVAEGVCGYGVLVPIVIKLSLNSSHSTVGGICLQYKFLVKVRA